MSWGSKLVYLGRSCIGPLSCLHHLHHALIKDVEGFCDWRGTVKADIHLCTSSSLSKHAFHSRVPRDIFPLILSSILMACLCWMMDEASLDPTQTSELINVILHEKLQKRNVSWTMPGCVTCHTCHASETHFRPILGNIIVEVTHVTSPDLCQKIPYNI